MVKYVKGDLLESNCDCICHQVNCQGVMGSGIANQIREKWPEVYAKYRENCMEFGAMSLLGTIQLVPLSSNQDVINIYSQYGYGYDGNRYTSYDAFDDALHAIKKQIPYGMSIAFPKNIGCGLGGGDWNIISVMIDTALSRYFDVYIYEYDPKEG